MILYWHVEVVQRGVRVMWMECGLTPRVCRDARYPGCLEHFLAGLMRIRIRQNVEERG
ncbi:MAG: hypothetical protein QXZ60_05130 [Sulfolobales archaeon]